MAIYNFKKETKLYVVRNGLRYNLEIYPDVNYSQTFNETSVPVKTLHSQFDMFENAVITRANPANFNFTIPIILESDMNIVFDMLLDYDTTSVEATLKTADLYVESNSEVYKLEKAVIESGVFQISNTAILTLNVSGTARKLSKHTGVIPGALQARSSNRSYTRINKFEVSIGGVLQTAVTSVNLEVRNNVTWVDFTTLQNSSVISDALGSIVMLPEAFVVGTRQLSGLVQMYVTDENNARAQTASVGSPMAIRAGSLGSAYTLDVDIPAAVYTNRVGLEDLLVQTFDFRMISNPAALNTVIKKRSV